MRGVVIAVLLALVLAAAGCGRVGFEAGQTLDASEEPTLDANTEPVLDASEEPALDANTEPVDAAPRGMVPTEGLVAHYSLDGDARDTMGGPDGVEIGGIQYETGHLGQAAMFDGLDDVIQLPALTNDDFTVALWVKTTVIAPGDLSDLWYSGLGIVDAELCGNPAGGDWGVALLAGGRVSTGAAKTDAQINDGVWHALAFTRKKTNDAYALYVDGVLDQTTSGPNVDMTYTDIPWIGLGNNPCDASRDELWFEGSIDDVRFYDRLLTPEEILALSEIVGDGPGQGSAFNPRAQMADGCADCRFKSAPSSQ